MMKSNGEAVFDITVNRDNVQASNFGNNSFQITNTGDKKIAKVEIDVTHALYPDSVFDPFGVAGDTVSKPLTINTAGGTGVTTPNNDSYIGAGGIDGFEAIQVLFDEAVNGGFEPGETLGFSVDMDPNSIAGATKSTLDSGANPPWDIGGVSGAELIGSSVTITFTDGSTATSQLQGAGNQAGAQTLVSQALPTRPVSLTVNGLGAGDVGIYDEDGPRVIVNGPAGQTARVVLTKGFIQPGDNNFEEPFKSQLDAQLTDLAASDFPANNAVEFQTVDVVLTGKRQDISDRFDFSNVADFDFEGEDQLPLGFTAGIIDPSNNDLPIGPGSDPIYLQFEESDNPNPGSALFRINAGGPEVAALDGGIAWSADTRANNSPFLADPGSNNTARFPAVEPAANVLNSVPSSIFDTERWDRVGGTEMEWAFEVPDEGQYRVNLFMGNGFQDTSAPGERVFDVAIEGTVLENLDDVDLSNQFGHQVGGVISNTVSVTDGILDIEFLHGVQNPLVNGIEVIQIL